MNHANITARLTSAQVDQIIEALTVREEVLRQRISRLDRQGDDTTAACAMLIDTEDAGEALQCALEAALAAAAAA